MSDDIPPPPFPPEPPTAWPPPPPGGAPPAFGAAPPASPPPAGPPAGARATWPSWKQTLIMLGGGIVLAISGCWGFVISLGYADSMSSTGVFTIALAGVFVVGLLAFMFGLVMLLMKVMRRLFRGPSPTSPPSQPNFPGTSS